MCHGQVLASAIVKARKVHRCHGCYATVEVGDKALRVSWMDTFRAKRSVSSVYWCDFCQWWVSEDGEACYEEGCVAEYLSEFDSQCATCGHDDEDCHSTDEGEKSPCTTQGCVCTAFVALHPDEVKRRLRAEQQQPEGKA
jgi:hypothetical protein